MLQRDQLGLLVEQYQARQINRLEFLQRSVALGMSLGAAGTLLAACGGDDDGAGGTDGAPSVSTRQLRVHLDEDIENLDPAINPGHTDTTVATNIFENLITYGPDDFDVVNELAESFEASEDGLRYDFKLKEGIQFQGGYG